jgi:membrane protein DedA with SNARE-associated domain/rhodanese-related sulfurtransferase
LRCLLERYGIPFLFGNLLLERLGLPVPAMPALILGGGLAADGRYPMVAVFSLALAACVLGDGALYLIGRRFGPRALRLLCGISLSPDSCVRKTSLHFERWGGWTLVLGKFLPGIGTLAPPLSGVMRVDALQFLLLSTLGSALWVGVSIGAGAVFHEQVTELLAVLERLSNKALIAVGVIVTAYVAFKWWERRRFFQTIRMARITADDLRALIERNDNPVIVDLRPRTHLERDPRSIPGAVPMDLAEVERQLAKFPKDLEIVFFCDCPNEASAASAAKLLMDLGYTRVRPLLGGIDAWVAAGYELSTPLDQAVPSTPSLPPVAGSGTHRVLDR